MHLSASCQESCCHESGLSATIGLFAIGAIGCFVYLSPLTASASPHSGGLLCLACRPGLGSCSITHTISLAAGIHTVQISMQVASGIYIYIGGPGIYYSL